MSNQIYMKKDGVWTPMIESSQYPVSVSNGGTGATTAADALINLGLTAELNYCDGVTSAIQTQINGKQSQIAAGTSGNVVTYSGTAGTIGSLAVDSTVGTGTNLVQNGAVKTAIDAITPHVNASGVLYFGTE